VGGEQKAGEIAASEVIELVKMRNKLAKQLGFKNYYSMSLELGEQDEKEIINIFSELKQLTDEPFKKLKNEIDEKLSERYRTKELKPWHYQDLFFQEGLKYTGLILTSAIRKTWLR